MVKLPMRADAVDRNVWPIAAPLARVAELLHVDLADVTEAAERVDVLVAISGSSFRTGEIPLGTTVRRRRQAHCH
jgi:hypothetical protein